MKSNIVSIPIEIESSPLSPKSKANWKTINPMDKKRTINFRAFLAIAVDIRYVRNKYSTKV